MFLGTYRHAVDAKGRLAIPARFREQLPTGTVISKGAEGCLQVYPPKEWARVKDRMRLGWGTTICAKDGATVHGDGLVRPRGRSTREPRMGGPKGAAETPDGP